MLAIANFIIDIMSYIRIPYKRIISEKETQTLMAILKKGDILLTKTPWALSNIFIQGEYKHAMIYLGSLEIIESNKNGVEKKALLDAMRDKSKYCILRIKAGEELGKNAADESLKYIGKKYDGLYSLDRNALYCSELVYFSYKDAGIDLNHDFILEPQELKEDSENWNMVHEFEV